MHIPQITSLFRTTVSTPLPHGRGSESFSEPRGQKRSRNADLIGHGQRRTGDLIGGQGEPSGCASRQQGDRHRCACGQASGSAFRNLVLVAAFSLAAAAGQTQDTSGNGMLKGSFTFRHLAVQIVDVNLNPTDITAVYGTITFDGAGNYTIAGTSVDNSVSGGAPQPLSMTGTYAIGSNGAGYLTNELYPGDQYAYINGAVAQGVFTGSSTESQQETNTLNDIFIAIPAGSPPTNASFTAPYQTGLIDFQNADSSSIMNALFELTPNGKGGFGAINLNGQGSNQTDSFGNYLSLTQSITGATYNFNSSGSATLTVPLPSGVSSTNALFTGSKTMYESADGNFILGWTASGFDIFFGVKALTITGTNTISQGLYFTAAVEDSPGFSGTDSYYGGTNNTGDSAGDGIVHQRINSPAGNSYDYGTDDQTELNADGTVGSAGNGFTDLIGYQYTFGDGGQAFVGIGTEGLFSLVVGMHAPAFSGPGVYLNPIGVNNAASAQPVTASLAPGEDIALYGTGLSSVTTSIQGGQVFPTTGLGGVTVTINGISCPLYSVSPGQINAVVPYEVASNPTGLANIQVTNNGVPSNVVQVYTTDASPGSFGYQPSNPQMSDPIGFAAARHAATGQLITSDNPAEPGEYISLYLTGLGTVSPAITDGAVGPSNPLSYSDLFNSTSLTVNFNDYNPNGSTGNQGNIQFAGLAPGFAGLYQINVQVPTSGLGAGDNVYVEFITDAADVNQIQIPFGFGSSDRPSAAARRRARAATIRARRDAIPRRVAKSAR
jgi:uncharacterized protein (TIGR03437 family)